MLLPTPYYCPPFPFLFGHIQTVFPTLCRKTPQTNPKKERIETADGDFIDIDFHQRRKGISAGSENLIVVSHGLEGNSRKKYPLGMAKLFTEMGYDVICLNFRGCSGEPNRLPRMYHSGITDDLHTVIEFGLMRGGYQNVGLIGFSMGGNQTLKYLGEAPENVFSQVKCAVVFSVPCMLADSVAVMNRYQNRLYMHYFMRGLKTKVREKALRFPHLIDIKGLKEMNTFEPFDDAYTAPIHGFSSGQDYYDKCSSKQFLSHIRVPTLLVQAADDPFLSKSCYPVKEAERSSYLHLEIPRYGGHVGFIGSFASSVYWSEERAAQFIREYIMHAG